MTKEYYIDILKNKWTRSVIKFVLVDPNYLRKFKYRLYLDNDPKHNLFFYKTWDKLKGAQETKPICSKLFKKSRNENL